MGKLIAIVAASVLVAGGAFGLVFQSDACGPTPVDPADCPVVKVGGCPYCSGAAVNTADSPAPDACCADAGAVAHAAGGDGTAAAAVAGSAGLLVTSKTKAAKKTCCCEEEPIALTAVVGVAAAAK
jgi:hypothetical protein